MVASPTRLVAAATAFTVINLISSFGRKEITDKCSVSYFWISITIIWLQVLKLKFENV